VISGVSLDGTDFFYPNPLECDMHYHFNQGGTLTRQPWFDCSRCPTNLARFIPSVAGYIYAHHRQDLYVNLYVQSSTVVDLEQTKVAVSQQTNYPWDGKIKLTVTPEDKSIFTIKLRIPGWSRNQPVPGDLYSYENKTIDVPVIKINGKEVDFEMEKGFAVLNHNWQEGDEIELILPMEVRKVLANEKVEDDRGKVAIERGPIVYCLEETDNPQIDEVAVSPDSEFSTHFDKSLLHGVEVIEASGNAQNENFKAIPYFVWDNRGASKMKVWLPQE